MDVLIKNMELPKSCYSDEFKYCPFLFFDYDTKSHCGLSDDIRCTKTRRPKGCPLVEVEKALTLEDAKSAYLQGHNLYSEASTITTENIEKMTKLAKGSTSWFAERMN